MIKAILEEHLNEVPTQADPIFGLHIPESVDNVPKDILTPRKTWKRAQDYDKKARELAEEFVENFKKYEASVTKEVLAASPKPTASHEKTRGKIQKLRG
jgi:phosphoenolpyruvate carboxykinase (ATP)